MKRILSLFLFLVFFLTVSAQTQKYKVSLIAFYNLENLFDTVNNPNINDEEFLPNSEYHYNTHVYFDKLAHLSDAISQIGTDINPDGIAFMGVSEVENDTVLNDLLRQDKLKGRKLKFVHYDSPADFCRASHTTS